MSLGFPGKVSTRSCSRCITWTITRLEKTGWARLRRCRDETLGGDFSYLDGWSMYHGATVPGFPQHPHRGFETVTVVRRLHVDHSDSLGGTARYGEGDVQ